MSAQNPYTDLGPLEPILADPAVMEIMINGPNQIFVERHGILQETGARFDSEEHLMAIIEQIVTPLGRVVNESHPMVDVRLADGSRVNVVIPPIALNGPFMTIRKFIKQSLTTEDLVHFGSWTPEIVEFIRACVLARKNIVIAGGTGSGKTTVFNILCSFIPNDERIVVVERANELHLKQNHVMYMEARPANLEGKGEITLEDLIINALKMRPDRILMGEARGGEVLHLIQAMNTGHDGSMLSVHATNPRDTLSRLEIMATMAGLEIPLLMLREQMGTAIDVIIDQQRLRDGSRKVLSISEVTGMKGSEIALQSLFEYVQTGSKDGKIDGFFTATGNVPTFLDDIEIAGIQLPASMFEPVKA